MAGARALPAGSGDRCCPARCPGRPVSYCMAAATMQLQRHERGIHAVAGLVRRVPQRVMGFLRWPQPVTLAVEDL